jgi:hypothetical protein
MVGNEQEVSRIEHFGLLPVSGYYRRNMPLADFSPLSFFKELHLLPRVIFTLGGGLLVAGFFVHPQGLVLALFGGGLVFLGVGLNLLMDSFWNETSPPYRLHISGHVMVQSVISFGIAIVVLYFAIHLYRYGVLPEVLRPIAPTSSRP